LPIKEYCVFVCCGFIQALLEAHDTIAEQYSSQGQAPWEEIKPAVSFAGGTKGKKDPKGLSNMSVDSEDSNVQYAQPIRIISLRKSPSQPLVRENTSLHCRA
jgi:hypothetical protein